MYLWILEEVINQGNKCEEVVSNMSIAHVLRVILYHKIHEVVHGLSAQVLNKCFIQVGDLGTYDFFSSITERINIEIETGMAPQTLGLNTIQGTASKGGKYIIMFNNIFFYVAK
ncbi:hypothetical protein ACJX0J_032506 [Zea mays]